jgi:membrane protease subunit HflK
MRDEEMVDKSSIENAAAGSGEAGSPEPQSVLDGMGAAIGGALSRAWGTVKQVLRGDGYSPIEDLRAAFGHLKPRRILLLLLALGAAAYLLSGIYTVQPGEAAVVRRFGKVVAPWVSAGLHYRLPWPIEEETIVNVSEVRRESVGLTEPEPDHPLHPEVPAKFQALSGDTNIVEYEVVVQYQIKEPADYLFNLDYPPYQIMRDAVRTAITSLTGSTGVEDILTTERQVLQSDLRQEVQTLLDQYGAGLAVVSVNLQKAYPPDEVADAFRDVSSAREDKSRSINQAEAYSNSIIPEARGQAEGIRSEAMAYAQAVVDQATGAAEGFEAILAEYEANTLIYGEDVTRYRLFLETMEKILPQVRTYVVQAGEAINLRLLAGVDVATFSPSPTDE